MLTCNLRLNAPNIDLAQRQYKSTLQRPVAQYCQHVSIILHSNPGHPSPSNLVSHLEPLHMLAFWGRLQAALAGGMGMGLHLLFLGTKASSTISFIK